MTTDLEKQFFDTFGIEPKKQCYYWDCPYSTGDISQDIPMGERKCNKCNNPNKEIYPEITDCILLELICIISSRVPLFGRAIWQEYLFDNVEDLKRGTLIILMGNMSEYNTLDYKEAVKHQVRTLFEEG